MKLLDIDSDSLGIPDTDYDARVTMSASELTRIVRDLSQLGESVRIEVSKDGVRFVSDGESANGSVLLKQTDGAARRYAEFNKDAEADADAEGAKKKVKTENGDDVDMQEDGEDAPEAEAEDGAEFQARSDDEGEEEQEESTSKKRKKAPAKVGPPSSLSPRRDPAHLSAGERQGDEEGAQSQGRRRRRHQRQGRRHDRDEPARQPHVFAQVPRQLCKVCRTLGYCSAHDE
jgi:proliferating cell nuclear antigen